MANIQELINRLEYLVDDDVSPDIAVMLFNMAQEDLSEVAGHLKVAESDFYNTSEFITLPDDLIRVEEVWIKKDGESNFTRRVLDAFVHKYERIPNYHDIERFELIGDQLHFLPAAPYDGQIRVRYYAMLPTIPVDLNYKPELKTNFHRALPLFAAAKYMQNWKDELNTKQDFMQEYMEVKAALFQETQERKQKNKNQFVIKVRGWS